MGIKRTRQETLNPFSAGRLNQGAGARHEAYIRHVCMMERILCRQNHLSAKRTKDRVVLQAQADVDFLLYGDASAGEVAAIDAKSFEGPRFGRSALTHHQMMTLAKYAQHGLHAGYVVLLRSDDAVCYFSIAKILAGGARAGFCAADGLLLGTRASFSLRKIWVRQKP